MSGDWTHAAACLWRSGDSLEASACSFHIVEPWVGTQVIWHGGSILTHWTISLTLKPYFFLKNHLVLRWNSIKFQLSFRLIMNCLSLFCNHDSITEMLLFISQVPLILFMSSITLELNISNMLALYKWTRFCSYWKLMERLIVIECASVKTSFYIQ